MSGFYTRLSKVQVIILSSALEYTKNNRPYTAAHGPKRLCTSGLEQVITKYIRLTGIKDRQQSVRKEKLAFIQNSGNEINVILFWEFEIKKFLIMKLHQLAEL